MPQDLPKHSRNEQITAKFGSLAQEASLSDAIFPPLLSGPVAARRYTTLGDLTTRIAFSSNYFRSSLLSHSLFVKKSAVGVFEKRKNDRKRLKTFEHCFPLRCFRYLDVLYLLLTPASKPQTDTRVQQRRMKRMKIEKRETREGKKERNVHVRVLLS